MTGGRGKDDRKQNTLAPCAQAMAMAYEAILGTHKVIAVTTVNLVTLKVHGVGNGDIKR